MPFDTFIFEVFDQQKKCDDSLTIGEKLLGEESTLRLRRFERAYEALKTARLSLNSERKLL